MVKAAPLVDIVILCHNKHRYTDFCLRGLMQTRYRPLHVIILDNGSTDETPRLLGEFKETFSGRGRTVTLLRSEENMGAVAGRNRAMKKRRGEYLVFMDNDVVAFSPDWLEKLVRFLEERGNAGAVSPKLIYPVEPFLIQCAGCDVAPTGRVNFRGRGCPRDDPRFNETITVQALISACMAVPARVADEVGEFDLLFSPVQFEDIDYCYRIKERGYDLYYHPAVELYHFENVTTSRTPTLNPVYNTVKNGMKFKKKWRHVFSRENGPEEKTMVWRRIETVDIDDIDPAALFGLNAKY